MKLAVSLFFSAAIITSSPKEDYMAFMGDFMKNSQLSFNFTITQNAEGKSQVSSGYYKRSDDQFLLKNENYLVISTKDVTVTVFENDKLVLMDEPTPANNLFVMNTEGMNEIITKVTETASPSKSIKEWHILGNGWKAKAIVKADIEKKVPIQISLFYKEANLAKDKPIMNISFSNFSKTIQDKEQFRISGILVKKGNEWVLTKKYSNYELINNLD